MDQSAHAEISSDKPVAELVLRVSDELDETYLRIIKKDAVVKRPVSIHGSSHSVSSHDLFYLSHDELITLVEQDDLLATINPIKYLFVRWGDHWEEIKQSKSSLENQTSPTLDEKKENRQTKGHFEVQLKPSVNLFEVEVQRVSDASYTSPRTCIPLSMRTCIKTPVTLTANSPSDHHVPLPFSVECLLSLNFEIDHETLSEDCTLRKVHMRYYDFDYEGFVRIDTETSVIDTKPQLPISAICPHDHKSVRLLLEYVDVVLENDKCTTTPSKYRVEELEDPLEDDADDTIIFSNKPRAPEKSWGGRKNSVLTRRRIPVEKTPGMKSSNDKLNQVLSMPEFQSLNSSALGAAYHGSKHLTAHEVAKSDVCSSAATFLEKITLESVPSTSKGPDELDTSYQERKFNPPQSPFFTGNPPSTPKELDKTHHESPDDYEPSVPPTTVAEENETAQNLLNEGWFSRYIDKASLTEALLLSPAQWDMEMRCKELWSSHHFPLPYINGKEYQSVTKWKKLIRRGVPFLFRSSLYSILLCVESFLLTRPSYFYASICSAFPYFSALENKRGAGKSLKGSESAISMYDTSIARNSNNPLFFCEAFPHFCPRSVPLFGMLKEQFSAILVSLFCEEGEIAVKTILCILCNQFPEFSYIPMLPALLCLLLLQLPSADKVAAAAYHCISTSAVCLGQRSRVGSNEYLFKENEEFNIFYAHLTLTESVHLSFIGTVYTLARKLCPGLRISSTLPSFQSTEKVLPVDMRSLYFLLIVHNMLSSLFTAILPIPLCLIIMDSYLNEGLKVLVRYGIALMILVGKELLDENESFFTLPFSLESLNRLLKSLKLKCTDRFAKNANTKGRGGFDELIDLSFALRIQRGHLSGILMDKDLKKYVFSTILSSRNDTSGEEHRLRVSAQQKSAIRHIFPTAPCLSVRASFALPSDDKQQIVQKPTERSPFASPSSILSTPMLWESFFTLLPQKILINHTIRRVYSTETDGWSLQSLYQKCMNTGGKHTNKPSILRQRGVSSETLPPSVLLLSVVPTRLSAFDESLGGCALNSPARSDLLNEIPASPLHATPIEPTAPASTTGAPLSLTSKPIRRFVLGAFLSVPPAITVQSDSSSSFIGSPDTFVFTLHPHVSVYNGAKRRSGRSTDAAPHSANYFYGSATELRVGLGDDGSAIVLETDLHAGMTSPCKTFHSPQLLSENDADTRVWERTQRFQVLQCEVLSFVENTSKR